MRYTIPIKASKKGDIVTADKEVLFWQTNKDWYRYDERAKGYRLTPVAPDRAKKSFALCQDKTRKGVL
jgi:hypothetical protein